MSRHWPLRIDDMLKAIEHIESILAREDSDSDLSGLAFERAFEILSEASRHLPSVVKARYGDTRWQDLADLGNIIRHAYDRVSIERLRETAHVDIPPLKSVLIRMKANEGSTPSS